jgi:hypothetical protein
MTTATRPATEPQPARTQGFGTARVLKLVFGSLGVLLALALIAAGVAAVSTLDKRDSAGFFTTAPHHLHTSTYALSSDSLDAGTDVPSWLFGDHFAKIRIGATSTDPSKALFVGIGRTADVDRYLTGVTHDRITDFETDPFSVSYRRAGGGAADSAPGAQSFWRVRSSGTGAQSITWSLEKGSWSAVAMNADATRGVDVQARLGARVPWVKWVVIGLFAVGGLLLVGSGALLYSGVRRRVT